MSDDVFVQEATEPSSEGGERYAHLAQRAAAYVRDAGGVVAEDALIAHVFGSIGTPALWRPLLRRCLGEDGDLVLRPDDCWAVPGVVGMTVIRS